MSDQSQGPGWWYASDGKWYPPADAADTGTPPTTPVAPATPAGSEVAPVDRQWDGTRWIDPSTGQWWDGERWQQPTAAAPAPAPATAPAPAAPSPPPATAGQPTSGSSGRGVLAVVAVVGVLVLLVAGFVVLRARDSGPSLGTDVVAEGTAASGPDELPSPDITLTDDTVVVRGNGGSTLKSMAPDGSTLTLDGSAEGIDQLEAGKVLLLTGVTVVKVTDVRREGSDVIVATEAASLGEVIRDGSLSWDEVPTSAASIQVWDARPEDIEESEGTISEDDVTDDGSSTSDDTSTGDGDGDEEEGSLGADPTGPSGPADPADPADPVGTGSASGPIASAFRAGAGVDQPFAGAQAALAAATAPSAQGASFLAPAQADPINKSGKLGDYSYSFSKVSGADGSSTYKLGLTREGNYVLKIDLDAQIDTIISSGELQVSGSTVDKLHLKSNKFNGTAKLSISAGTGETIAPVKQDILTIPVSINFPIVVYGIPFAITVKGKFLIEPAFTSKNATVSGQAEVTFGGTAGLTYQGGSLSAEGAMTQKGANPMEYVSGLGVGVTGIVFASQFPRLGFGIGYGSSGAGVYLANTTSAGITISSAIGMVPCNSISITSTTSAGAEAKLLGIDLPLGQRLTTEISKETWNYYAPETEACKNMAGG